MGDQPWEPPSDHQRYGQRQFEVSRPGWLFLQFGGFQAGSGFFEVGNRTGIELV
jgi:hypothetical protein